MHRQKRAHETIIQCKCIYRIYGRKLSRSLMTHWLNNWQSSIFYLHEDTVNGKVWTETVEKQWHALMRKNKDFERVNSSVLETVTTFCNAWGSSCPSFCTAKTAVVSVLLLLWCDVQWSWWMPFGSKSVVFEKFTLDKLSPDKRLKPLLPFSVKLFNKLDKTAE